MPKPNKSVGEVKYSSLTTSMPRIIGTRTFSRHQVGIIGRTDQYSQKYRFTFTIYERQPLYALGEAVVRFFVNYPKGIISAVEVKTIY